MLVYAHFHSLRVTLNGTYGHKYICIHRKCPRFQKYVGIINFAPSHYAHFHQFLPAKCFRVGIITYISLRMPTYPTATSSIIISKNPTINPSVPIVSFSHMCACGISSSTTTYIIVPAASDRRSGNAGTISPANNAASTPNTGSTTADMLPSKNAFFLLSPSPFKGSATATPSG